MSKFLESVVEDILKIPDFYKDIFLFPNKRSVLYFEQHLKKNIENPFLFPYSKDLREFVFEVTELNNLDNFNLTFEFFNIYKKIFVNESFETFFMWSQILLKDFEEIDFSNRSSKEILRNIAELQKIEGYVESFGSENPTEFRKKFFYFWDNFESLYTNYVTHLVKNRKSAYYGYALKYLNQKLQKNEIFIKGRNIYLVGFSDLQKSEIELINLLKDRIKFYFDVDSFFFAEDKSKSEVARLFSKIENQLHISIQKSAFIENHPIQIFLIPCPNSIEQFKIQHYLLKKLINEKKEVDLEDFAIILNDSSYLDTLLNSLPSNLQHINITLGYSLERTYIAQLTIDLLQLKLYNLTSKFRELLIKTVHQPYVQYLLGQEEMEKIRQIPFYSSLSIEDETFLTNISFINSWLSKENFVESLNFLIEWIIDLKEKNYPLSSIEQQELYYFLLFLTKFKNNIESININIDWSTFLLIYKQLLQTEFIPFSGEPLKGLQIMELAESQCLDFQYVFIMNVNEGTLPKSPDYSSFIPMEIKRLFGLRTPEDFDARFAYLFYRLFHRAHQIYLFYNQSDNEEESRFIRQIEILLKNVQNVEIKKWNLNFRNTALKKMHPIEIYKNNDILNKIHSKMKDGIAPTTLLTYLSCPLKFYYIHIEKIKPDDVFEEDLKANEFGTIAHDSLKKIYLSFNTNQKVEYPYEINSDILKNNTLMKYEIIKEQFEKNVKGKTEDGKNYFLLKVIEDIIKQIISKDIERLDGTSVEIYRLEEPLSKKVVVNQIPVVLNGIVDRIEYNSTGYQIIDYKSGRIGKTYIPNLKVFDSENIQNYKEAFQLVFYSMLLSHELSLQEKNQNIYSGIYSFRNLKEGLINLKINKKNTNNSEENLYFNYTKYQEEFEGFILETIQEILDSNIPFSQTKYEQNCKYCPFIKNCGKFHLL